MTHFAGLMNQQLESYLTDKGAICSHCGQWCVEETAKNYLPAAACALERNTDERPIPSGWMWTGPDKVQRWGCQDCWRKAYLSAKATVDFT